MATAFDAYVRQLFRPPGTKRSYRLKTDKPLVTVRGLDKVFPWSGSNKVIQACQDVSFDVGVGETVGIVGESGSGKTTLGRCILRLIEPTAGEVIFDGQNLSGASSNTMRRLRRDMRIVFQEPVESLNPRLSVGRQISEPLRIHTKMSKTQRSARVLELLGMVGLDESVANTLPGALSAGAAQRCSIARAIATDPKLIVLDEPTSALAPEAEADLIRLLSDLQQKLGIAYIFISHNLALVAEICDRIVVMYLSQVVEIGTAKQIFQQPQHPYTRALIAATLLPDPAQRSRVENRWERLAGEIPSPIALPRGCYLASRCLYALDRCRNERQLLQACATDGRPVRCWRAADGLSEAEIAVVRDRAILERRQRVQALMENSV